MKVFKAKLRVLVVVVLAHFVHGCTGDQDAHYVEVPARQVNSNLKVASQLWDRLETTFQQQYPGSVARLTDIKVTFFKMHVLLREKNPGVLGGDNFRIPIPNGGGVVDLAEFVKTGRRSFFLKFEFPEEVSANNMHVFFMSHYFSKTIEDEPHGMGCYRGADITSYFRKKIQGSGLILNTTDWRYLNLIGGAFVFYDYHGGQFYLSQVTFEDSRYDQDLCEYAKESLDW